MLASIARCAFDPAYGESWSSTQLTGTLSQTGTWAELASLGGKPAAFSLARIAADEAELLLVATLPHARRMNLGRALLQRVSLAAQARGAVFLHLEVRRSNKAALALYRSCGLSQIGERKAYYRGVDGRSHDAVTMQAALPLTSS
ncbi:GNAT family N-acetyltransferase [Pacificimonas sp. WHA3]|uniref:GNAT family N-acetyltransferase n=1 Tax=Pacificimonas pallii TaxID=2827236 RepID=A0ABS6SEF0_9SPHN|nr:GNAT family N-acetyltransferase [Pacificimonas pallii]